MELDEDDYKDPDGLVTRYVVVWKNPAPGPYGLLRLKEYLERKDEISKVYEMKFKLNSPSLV